MSYSRNNEKARLKVARAYAKVTDARRDFHWTCPQCGTLHDRDVNAAKNILAAGRAESRNACRGDASPGATLADASEAGSRRSAA